MAYAQRLMQTRWGMTLVAGLAAALAGVLVLVYVQRYRNSVKAEGAPVTVLVAKQAIPKGTAGAVIATQGFYTATTIRQSQLLERRVQRRGSSLRDKVAVRDIYPGSQLRRADFASGDGKRRVDARRSTSGRSHVPFDSAHGTLATCRPATTSTSTRSSTSSRSPRTARRSHGAAAACGDPDDHAERRRCSTCQEDGGRLREHRLQGDRCSGGEACLRVGQRQALACHPAGGGREGIPADPRDARDTAARASSLRPSYNSLGGRR